MAAIVAADVVGYSAQMGTDEDDAARRLSALRDLVETYITENAGRIVNWSGDGMIAEFSSPVSAVRTSFEMQRKLAAPQYRDAIGFDLRVGIHLADVLFDNGDLIGDGVNIASRIEALAAPGSVCLSRAVFDHVKRNSQLRFEPLGEKALKNISDPVEIFAVLGELGNHSLGTAAGASEDSLKPKQAPLPPKTVIIVPFRNLSSDPDQEYFADGFSEDIITELSRFSDLQVTSRNASFVFKDTKIDATEIGRRTGVRFCLEGGIRRLGDRIRVNCHLVDCKSGEQIWSEKFDCGYAEVFDAQDIIVGKIAASVFLRMGRQIEQDIRRKHPADMEAYECLMRGLALYRMGGVTRDVAAEAAAWFERAIKKDPTLGRAYAWRACAIATLAEWDGSEYLDEAMGLARKALELDDASAEPHRIMGSICLYTRDFDKALYYFGKGLELNPNHAYVLARTGEVHNFLGDGKTALEYQQRAKALDPFLPEYCRELEVVAHYVLGEYAECDRITAEFSRLTRRSAAYRAAAAVRLGDPDLLSSAAHDLIELDPDFSPASFVEYEFYKDPAFAAALRDDLETALGQLNRSFVSTGAGLGTGTALPDKSELH